MNIGALFLFEKALLCPPASGALVWAANPLVVPDVLAAALSLVLAGSDGGLGRWQQIRCCMMLPA